MNQSVHHCHTIEMKNPSCWYPHYRDVLLVGPAVCSFEQRNKLNDSKREKKTADFFIMLLCHGKYILAITTKVLFKSLPFDDRTG